MKASAVVGLFCFGIGIYVEAFVTVPVKSSCRGKKTIFSSEGEEGDELSRNVPPEDGRPRPGQDINPSDDVTDRFRYKVNALMGVFDPPDPSEDTERQNGNILNAMLRFPVRYSFNVVGKTEGKAELQEIFVSQVKHIVLTSSGESEHRLSCQVVPRGRNYTKVTVEAEVESAAVITNILQRLEELELSVMQF